LRYRLNVIVCLRSPNAPKMLQFKSHF